MNFNQFIVKNAQKFEEFKKERGKTDSCRRMQNVLKSVHFRGKLH